jgi:RNA polymerase sigma-70 factor (ECF subfamily)
MSVTAESDPERLLGQVRTGDEQALGGLLDAYRNYLMLLARTQIGRRFQGKLDAADVVQETFLTAHRCFGQFRGSSEPELLGWLRQILATTLANRVYRHYGTRGRDVTLERQLSDELEQSSQVPHLGLVAPQSSPSQQAARREQAVLLADALQRLPAVYREVLILRHWEGLSFPEVARRLERTVGAVEKLWIRALARLRRVLGVAL